MKPDLVPHKNVTKWIERQIEELKLGFYSLGRCLFVVEISISRLAGDQDVFANVQRWMKQIGLDDSTPIQLDISDDKKTIFVRMPK